MIIQIPEIVAAVVPVLQEYGVMCCYMFGSRAGAEHYPESDVDLAVLFESRFCRRITGKWPRAFYSLNSPSKGKWSEARVGMVRQRSSCQWGEKKK
ncbi:MAG: nucleotidyltransferase domain-containing protein [Bacillota bacterium]